MGVGLGTGQNFADEGEWLATTTKDEKRRNDSIEMAQNEKSGDFQSRFFATDRNSGFGMPLEDTEKLTDAFKSTPGMVTPGNIDLTKRPVVKNPDGSISTVRSMSVNFDGQETLIPTVAHDGSRVLSNDEAIQQYKDSGQHLGTFTSPESASAYAEILHKDQEKLYTQPRSILNKLTGLDGGERFQTWPERVIRSSLSGMALPGDVYQGKVEPDSIQAIERAADLATLAVMGPAPLAKKMADGTLGSFAGVVSKTVDKTALEVAQLAEKEGLSVTEIWRKTGFFRGADKRWRYEIDDSKASYNPPAWPSGSNSTNVLGNILDHPELYEAYPSLKDVQVIRDVLYPSNSAHFDGSRIVMGEKAFRDKSIMMHEVQHVIQDLEGFAQGGSAGKSSAFHQGGYKLRYEDDVQKLRPEFLKLQTKEAKGEFLSQEEKAKLDYFKHVFVKYVEYARAGDVKARENYLALAGETEARNTETRLEMQPRERNNISPFYTQDTMYKDQIIYEIPVLTNPYMKPNYLGNRLQEGTVSRNQMSSEPPSFANDNRKDLYNLKMVRGAKMLQEQSRLLDIRQERPWNDLEAQRFKNLQKLHKELFGFEWHQ